MADNTDKDYAAIFATPATTEPPAEASVAASEPEDYSAIFAAPATPAKKPSEMVTPKQLATSLWRGIQSGAIGATKDLSLLLAPEVGLVSPSARDAMFDYYTHGGEAAEDIKESDPGSKSRAGKLAYGVGSFIPLVAEILGPAAAGKLGIAGVSGVVNIAGRKAMQEAIAAGASKEAAIAAGKQAAVKAALEQTATSRAQEFALNVAGQAAPFAAAHGADMAGRTAEAGGDTEDMAKAFAAGYASTTASFAVPMATKGRLLKRVVTGAAVQPAVGLAQNEVDNQFLPEEAKSEPTGSDLAAQAVLGGVLGAAGGGSARDAHTADIVDTLDSRRGNVDAEQHANMLKAAQEMAAAKAAEQQKTAALQTSRRRSAFDTKPFESENPLHPNVPERSNTEGLVASDATSEPVPPEANAFLMGNKFSKDSDPVAAKAQITKDVLSQFPYADAKTRDVEIARRMEDAGLSVESPKPAKGAGDMTDLLPQEAKDRLNDQKLTEKADANERKKQAGDAIRKQRAVDAYKLKIADQIRNEMPNASPEARAVELTQRTKDLTHDTLPPEAQVKPPKNKDVKGMVGNEPAGPEAIEEATAKHTEEEAPKPEEGGEELPDAYDSGTSRNIIKKLWQSNRRKNTDILNLLNSGKLVLAKNAEVLGRDNLGNKAEYDPSTGKMYIYTDHVADLDSDALRKEITKAGLHEAGHGVIDSGASDSITGRIFSPKETTNIAQKIRASSSKLAQDAVRTVDDHVAKGNISPEHADEELLTYFTHNVAGAREGTLGTARGAVSDIVAAAKDKLRKAGMDMDVSINDIASASQKTTSELYTREKAGAETGQSTEGTKSYIGNSKSQTFLARARSGKTYTDPLGKQKYLQSDKDAEVRMPVLKAALNNGEKVKLSYVLKHPELYKDFPELRNMDVEVKDTGSVGGWYAPKTRSIVLDKRTIATQSPAAVKQLLMHEIQHGLQDIGGESHMFVGGQKLFNARDAAYKRLQNDDKEWAEVVTSNASALPHDAADITLIANSRVLTHNERVEELRNILKYHTSPEAEELLRYIEDWDSDHQSNVSNLERANEAIDKEYYANFPEAEARFTQKTVNAPQDLLDKLRDPTAMMRQEVRKTTGGRIDKFTEPANTGASPRAFSVEKDTAPPKTAEELRSMAFDELGREYSRLYNQRDWRKRNTPEAKAERQAVIQEILRRPSPDVEEFPKNIKGMKADVLKMDPEKTRQTKELAADLLSPISRQLSNIGKGRVLRNMITDYFYSLQSDVGSKMDQTDAFLKKLNRLDKDTKERFSLALMNGDSKTLDRLVADNGMKSEYARVRAVLDDLGNKLKDRGFIDKVSDTYFPRRVKDYTGLINHLAKSDPALAERAKKLLAEAQGDSSLSPEEIDNIMASVLYGKNGDKQKGWSKERYVQQITPDMLKYYETPTATLHSHILSSAEQLHRSDLFGLNATHKEVNGVKVLQTDASVSSLMKNMKGLQPAEVRRATELFKTALTARSTAWALQQVKNITLLQQIGNLKSAAGQAEDIMSSTVIHGVMPTVKAVIQRITGKMDVSAKTLGVTRNLYDEFANKSRTSKLLNSYLKNSLFEGMDVLGKDILTQSSVNKGKQLASTPSGKLKLTKQFGEYLGKEKTEQLIDDLSKGKVTDLTKFYAYSKLAEVQPINAAEMPKAWKDHPNSVGMAGLLKGFTAKRIDYIVGEAISKIKEGDKSEGVKHLVATLAGLSAAGIPALMLKQIVTNVLDGTDTPIKSWKDQFIYGLYNQFGVTPYTVDKATGVSKEEAAKMRAEGHAKARSQEADPIGAVQDTIQATPWGTAKRVWNRSLTANALSMVPAVGSSLAARQDRKDKEKKAKEKANGAN